MWSGYISFGLVTISVKLYAATEDVRTPPHEVHTCGSRIRHRRVCEREQREVPQDEIRCGWQAPDGAVVVLDTGDLEHLPLPVEAHRRSARLRARRRRRPADVRPPVLGGPGG
jgi:DNA end-binding protein Ku